MPTLSTHILDTSVGLPAADVTVTLSSRKNGQWSTWKSGKTNSNGRLVFAEVGNLTIGVYKLNFATKEYFEENDSLYPYIEVVFEVKENGPTHLHIPLLLNPFGYTTYRGS